MGNATIFAREWGECINISWEMMGSDVGFVEYTWEWCRTLGQCWLTRSLMNFCSRLVWYSFYNSFSRNWRSIRLRVINCLTSVWITPRKQSLSDMIARPRQRRFFCFCVFIRFKIDNCFSFFNHTFQVPFKFSYCLIFFSNTCAGKNSCVTSIRQIFSDVIFSILM